MNQSVSLSTRIKTLTWIKFSSLQLELLEPKKITMCLKCIFIFSWIGACSFLTNNTNSRWCNIHSSSGIGFWYPCTCKLMCSVFSQKAMILSESIYCWVPYFFSVKCKSCYCFHLSWFKMVSWMTARGQLLWQTLLLPLLV